MKKKPSRAAHTGTGQRVADALARIRKVRAKAKRKPATGITREERARAAQAWLDRQKLTRRSNEVHW